MFHMVASLHALVTHNIEDVERAQGILGAGESSATHLECFLCFFFCFFFRTKAFTCINFRLWKFQLHDKQIEQFKRRNCS